MRLITLLLLSVVLIGCEKELPVFKGSPLEREGLFYAPNSTEPLTADVEEYYESGALERTFALIDGAKQGLEQSWYEKGQLKKELKFVNGKQDGLFQQWHENGQLKDEATSVKGKAEGLQRKWHEDGHLLREATYVNGKLEGLTQLWDENGEPGGRFCYKADEKTGLSYCTEGKQP